MFLKCVCLNEESRVLLSFELLPFREVPLVRLERGVNDAVVLSHTGETLF